VTRAEALEAAAREIARAVPDLKHLIDLLEAAGGVTRLAAALRAVRPEIAIGGGPRGLDAKMWLEGRVR
jgi:hypothetical protein